MSIQAHITTLVISVTVSIATMAVWQHYHPAPIMAKADIMGILLAQQKSLSAQMKPGMDQKAQAAIIESASRFGKQLDAALTQVAAECNCTIINSAAIVKDAPSNRTVDYTQRVNALATGGQK